MSSNAAGVHKNPNCTGERESCPCSVHAWYRSMMRASIFKHKVEHALVNVTCTTLEAKNYVTGDPEVDEARFQNLLCMDNLIIEKTPSDEPDLAYLAWDSGDDWKFWGKIGKRKYGEWWDNIGGVETLRKSQ